jgi:hypothetical protein
VVDDDLHGPQSTPSLQNLAAATTAVGPILTLDLDKYKSVAGAYDGA